MIKLPDFIREEYGSTRAYKAAKRIELRAVEKAFADLWFAGAYVPPRASIEMTNILASLQKIKLELMASRWGR